MRNGDRWTVTEVRDGGSLTLRRADPNVGASVVLADYAAEHLDLGYAVYTSYRAQGITVQASHVLVDASMTRGEPVRRAHPRPGDEPRLRRHRQARRLRDGHRKQHRGHRPKRAARGAPARRRRALSAHETITTEQEAWANISGSPPSTKRSPLPHNATDEALLIPHVRSHRG